MLISKHPLALSIYMSVCLAVCLSGDALSLGVPPTLHHAVIWQTTQYFTNLLYFAKIQFLFPLASFPKLSACQL